MKDREKTNEKTVTELICELKVGEKLTRPIHLLDSTRQLVLLVKLKPEHKDKKFTCFRSSDKSMCIVTREPEYNIPNEIKEFIGDVFASKDDVLALKAGEMFKKYCM